MHTCPQVAEFFACWSLIGFDNYSPFWKNEGVNTHCTRTARNTNVSAPLIWEGEEEQGLIRNFYKLSIPSAEKHGGLTWMPSEKQPCLALVDRWGRLHLEIRGLTFGEFDPLPVGCG